MAIRFNISVTTILLVAVVIFLVISPQTLCNAPRIKDRLSVVEAMQWLKTRMYQQAEAVTEPKPEYLPPAVKETAVSTTHGEGVWIPPTNIEQGDSVEVEISVVELVNETAWVKVVIDGDEVKWHKLEHYHVPLPERKWTLFAEATNAESTIGIGIGYRIWKPLDINVSPAVSVSTSLDWIAGEVRLSRNIFSGVAFGGGVGYRFGAEDGLHLSAGVSIEL